MLQQLANSGATTCGSSVGSTVTGSKDEKWPREWPTMLSLRLWSTIKGMTRKWLVGWKHHAREWMGLAWKMLAVYAGPHRHIKGVNRWRTSGLVPVHNCCWRSSSRPWTWALQISRNTEVARNIMKANALLHLHCSISLSAKSTLSSLTMPWWAYPAGHKLQPALIVVTLNVGHQRVKRRWRSMG